MESLSKKLRSRLSEKDIIVFKLSLWACLLTWMVMFLIFSVTMAISSAGIIKDNMSGFEEGVLYYLVPIWIVFTALLTVAFVMGFANKKLRSPKEEVKDGTENNDQ